MTTLPRSSSSWTRNGRTSTMRALVWESLVTMPDWEPVKLTAGTPRALRAMDRRAIDMRSPAESSMSSSRRAGLSVSFLASASSSSVVSPMAETTTTTSLPAALALATRSATWRILSTSATDEPPYFWTTMATLSPPAHLIVFARGPRRRPDAMLDSRARAREACGYYQAPRHVAEHRRRGEELAAAFRVAAVVRLGPAPRPRLDRHPDVDGAGGHRHQGHRALHARPGAAELQVPVVAADGPLPAAHPGPHAVVDPAEPGRA